MAHYKTDRLGTMLFVPGTSIKVLEKTYTGYAPMLNGKLLIDEIVSHTTMRTMRCKSKIVSKSGRITSKWGPETSWSQKWKNEGATICKVKITIPYTPPNDTERARRKLASQAESAKF